MYLLILDRASRSCIDIYNGWKWNNEADRYNIDRLGLLQTSHLTKVNSYLARYDFHQCQQGQDEAVDEFLSRLRLLR